MYVFFGILLDERTGLRVDDDKSRQRGLRDYVLELRHKRPPCGLSLEGNRVPRHLGDVALEVVDLAVVRHKYDLDEVFVLAGLDVVPEFRQLFGIKTTRRCPVRTKVQADVLEALVLGLRVPLGNGEFGVVWLDHIVSEESGSSRGVQFHLNL